jgi:hypothetical protein
MVSVIRGDDNFDSGSVGSTTYGAVGTYVGGYVNSGVNVFKDNNSTVSGSSILKYNGTDNDGYSLGATSSGGTTSAGLSGTWRVMGAYKNSATTFYFSSIFVRIS